MANRPVITLHNGTYRSIFCKLTHLYVSMSEICRDGHMHTLLQASASLIYPDSSMHRREMTGESRSLSPLCCRQVEPSKATAPEGCMVRDTKDTNLQPRHSTSLRLTRKLCAPYALDFSCNPPGKHIHIHIYVYIHTYVLTHTHTYIYIYVCICTCIFLYLYIYTSTHTHLYTYTHIHMFATTHLQIYASTNLRIYTSTHLHTYTSTRPHIYTSTNLHISMSPNLRICISTYLHIYIYNLCICTHIHTHVLCMTHIKHIQIGSPLSVSSLPGADSKPHSHRGSGFL